ncbi:helix-turn-helix domain-containing protein [Chitinophaga pinensis]|uniref:helix-turn-helix domain-containing protein n=1 Tax=Chitinophaga pinensis TaxID=79329 RepID=UPI001646934B|nr:AraC family transcriptional regulator [Chitinophaga pinensis]
MKQQEALLLLLHLYPAFRNILFDFSLPVKTDLEQYMEENFHFNVPLEKFAFLSGRSLSSFKRDFHEIFGETPSRWLLKRRLDAAYQLISRQGRSASEIYLDLGFQDLSHFSFSFKKRFGTSPSQVIA